MVDQFPQVIDKKAQRAFDKVKADIETLRKENTLLREKQQKSSLSEYSELKKEITLLRDKHDAEIQHLKGEIAKCTCSENKADINDLRRDIARVSVTNLKDEVSKLRETQREHAKLLRSLQNSMDSVLANDSIQKRLEEVENDMEERIDTLERLAFKSGSSSYSSQKEDEAIEKFANSYDNQSKEKDKKGFRRWLFSKEEDTDDINEVK